MKLCAVCDEPLTGRQRRFCSDRCRKRHARNPDGNADRIAATPDSGQVAEAVLRFAETLPLDGPGDVRVPIVRAAVALGEALDRGQNPAGTVRELRTLLSYLADFDEDGASRLDELRGERARRRLELILGDSA